MFVLLCPCHACNFLEECYTLKECNTFNTRSSNVAKKSAPIASRVAPQTAERLDKIANNLDRTTSWVGGRILDAILTDDEITNLIAERLRLAGTGEPLIPRNELGAWLKQRQTAH